MTLLERIDIALQRSGKSRADLAEHLGTSVQAISNLKRKPGSTLRPEKLCHTARFLACDVFWLCTGEGGRYVAAGATAAPEPEFSWLARDIAKWFDTLSDEEQAQALVVINRLRSGKLTLDGAAATPKKSREKAARA